jgi:hypothetical protein
MQRASRDANVYMFQNTKVRSKNIDGRMDYVIYVRWRHTRTMDEKGGNGEQFQNEKKSCLSRLETRSAINFSCHF